MRHLHVRWRGVSCLAHFVALFALASHSITHAQTITKISPLSGPATTAITITGTGFGATKGTVTFGGAAAASITSWTDTQIVVLPFNLNVPVDASLDVVVTNATTNKQSNSMSFKETMPALMPATGPAGTKITIHGTGFGAAQGANSAITFNGQSVSLTAGTAWSDTTLSVDAPDAGAHMNVYLKVFVTDSSGNSQEVGEFEETAVAGPKAAGKLMLTPATGYSGMAFVITGQGFGETQGKQVLLFDGKTVSVTAANWTDTKITAAVPGFPLAANNTTVAVSIQDGNGNTTFGPENFVEAGAPATLSHNTGVAGDTVTITGQNFPNIATDKNAQVLFNQVAATVQPKSSSDSTLNWNTNSITVSAPNLHPSHGSPGTTVPVTVMDGNNNVVAQSSVKFTETRDMWGDQDENPLDIRFVGGYEQGYLSSQSSSNDGFLAVYGRKLFGATEAPAFGPYFAVRLLTAPQASNTDNVSSVLTNPTGSVTASNLQGVGSAVDVSLGFEWQFKGFSDGRTTLSAIGGGGFVTPLQANSVTATFQMPAFGTVECTELQNRLASVLSGPNYTNVEANTTSANNACFSNKTVDSTTNLPTAITLLQYASPDNPNFFPKYSVGLRMINRWPGVTGGPRHCTDAHPCERGYVDFTLGGNASLTGGILKHGTFGVLTVDSTYPLPVPNLNYLYLFGTFSKRISWNLPQAYPPLILASGSSSSVTAPSASLLVVPMKQPDRDFYRFGAGVNILKIFTALTGQTKQQ